MKRRHILAILIGFLFLISIFLFLYSPRLLGYVTFGDPYFNTCLINLVDNFSPLNSKSIVYLKFNNLSSYGEYDLIACDFSGHNNTALLINTICNSSGGPFNDGAFEFKGNNTINIIDRDELSPSTSGAFSVSFWIKPSTFNFDGNVFDHVCECAVHPVSKYSSFLGNNREWYFRIYNGSAVDGGTNRPKRISFYVFNLTGSLGAGSYFQEDLNESEWIHVIGVMNGTHTFIYKNGILKDSDPISNYDITMGNGNAPIVLGGISQGGYFLGYMDELRIFNRTLNSSEINELYNINLSVVEHSLNVDIVSPANITYNISNYSINITLDEEGYCEYSLDGGVSNNSLLSNDDIEFGVLKNGSDGGYMIETYCNNSLGVKNYTERVFFSINVINNSNSSEEIVLDSGDSGGSSSSGSSSGSDSSGGGSGGGGGGNVVDVEENSVEDSNEVPEPESHTPLPDEETDSNAEGSSLVGLAINENLERNKRNISVALTIIVLAVGAFVGYLKCRT